jgi:hypothetical protein
MQKRETTTSLALEALKRREEIESLRPHLIHEHCFQEETKNNTKANVTTQPIEYEELKKLAKAWNLNAERNFWKNHAMKDDLINALLRYKCDNEPSVGRKSRLETQPQRTPVPPLPSTRPSMRFGDLGFGVQRFGRDVGPEQLCIESRFVGQKVPLPEDSMVHTIDRWRDEDMRIKDSRRTSKPKTNFLESTKTVKTSTIDNDGKSSTTNNTLLDTHNSVNKNRQDKHRSLAMLLLNFSTSPGNFNHSSDGTPHFSSLKSVETFLNVADSKDSEVSDYARLRTYNI